MNRQRIEHLRRILLDVEAEEKPFNMQHWWIDYKRAEVNRDLQVRMDAHVGRECGTAACALGWAAQDKEFIAQGLHLSTAGFNGDLGIRYPIFDGRRAHGTTFSAAAEFFDITLEKAFALFDPTEYDGADIVKPRHVIERIEKWLEKTK